MVELGTLSRLGLAVIEKLAMVSLNVAPIRCWFWVRKDFSSFPRLELGTASSQSRGTAEFEFVLKKLLIRIPVTSQPPAAVR
jgi:hypothetical protein